MAELKNIADSLESGQIILIEDSSDASGRALLQHFAQSSGTRSSSVHIVCLDQEPNLWRKQLPASSATKTCLYDGYSDPLGWESRQPVADGRGAESVALRCDGAAEFSRAVESGVQSSQGRAVVVVDSLSPLLRHQPVSWCCRWLKQLARLGTCTGSPVDAVRVLVLVHSDLHSDATMAALAHVSNTVLSLSSPPTAGPQLRAFSSTVAAQDSVTLCEMTHRRASGKLCKETSLVSVSSSSFQLRSVVFDANADDNGGTTAVTASAAPDPTANLTFNLRLTSQEKEARSNVVLPYTQVRRQGRRDRTVAGGPSSGQLGASGGGQIFYQADDADDFDEEDPDDDLDI